MSEPASSSPEPSSSEPAPAPTGPPSSAPAPAPTPAPAPAPAAAPAPPPRRGVRGIGLITIIAGLIFAVAGVVAYVAVQQTLSDQKIVVSDDASMFAGKKVDGPFTAYSQAMVIGKHAKEIAGGKTYAELPQDDPNRDTVMTASFLQASLFTSVVAFGVSAMATVLGLLLILLGLAIRRLDPKTR